MKSKIVLSLVFSLLLMAFFSGAVAAKSLSGEYFNQDSDDSYAPSQYLKPSEIVSLFPMLEDAEAKVTHAIPQCPVIINGIKYKPEEITKFNGQRLHFTTDKAGSLYAFTDAKAMEAFIENEYGPVFELAINDKDVLALSSQSELFENWLYSGDVLFLSPGNQLPQLFGWDNRISSAKITSSAPVTLWDSAWYGGDSFTMMPGSNHSALAFEGWNDRASSIS